MKKKLILTTSILALLCFSCSSDDSNPTSNSGGDVQVKFTTSLQKNNKFLGEGSTAREIWQGDDHIGIFKVSNATHLVVDGEQNIEYKSSGSEKQIFFEPAGSKVIYYPNDLADKVDFIAYHPYNQRLDNWNYSVELNNQSNPDAIELLFAKADNSGKGFDKTSGVVDFDFQHQLVKLVIKLDSQQTTDLSITNVVVNGMNTKAKFDLKGQNGLTDYSNIMPITGFMDEKQKTFEFILLPVSVLGPTHTIVFTSSQNTTHTLDLSSKLNALRSGNLYQVDLEFNEQEIQAGITVEKWTVDSPKHGTAQ
ncbi:fimbrillin family protein [Myroides sp. LJL110]